MAENTSAAPVTRQDRALRPISELARRFTAARRHLRPFVVNSSTELDGQETSAPHSRFIAILIS